MTTVIGYGSPLPPITLADASVTVRPFTSLDIALVEEASHDDLIPKITTVPTPLTPEAGHAYIDRQLERRSTGQGWSLAIADRKSDRALGQIGLWITNIERGRAEIGYWVASSARGRRAASHAVRLMSDWAFEHLDIDRLSLFIEPWNEASISTAERSGFTREGLLTSWERVGGDATDMLSFARIRG